MTHGGTVSIGRGTLRRPLGPGASTVQALRNLAAGVCVGALAGCAGSQSALDPAGPEARLLAQFWWVMLAVAALVTLLVLAVLLAGLLRGRGQGRPLAARQSRRLVWAGGVILPLAVTIPFVVSSFSIGRQLDARAPAGALTVEVVGRLWWWEVHYLDAAGRREVTTANEIHLPTGRPIRLRLTSDNVIHSYWVPKLHGKMDMIPGRVNTLALTLDEPGVYRGQCAEYCGVQHALMAFLVVAEPPERFAVWLARQRWPATEPLTPQAQRGQEVFIEAECADCHRIRGTAAEGDKGPDLTHFGSRRTLAAATLPNRIGHLGGWIADPQGAKPGSKMPPTALAPADLHALLAYLEGLE